MEEAIARGLGYASVVRWIVLVSLSCGHPDGGERSIAPSNPPASPDRPGLEATSALVTMGPRQRCADPARRDEAWWDTVTFPDPTLEAYRLTSSGLVITDLTGDDRPDLLLPGESETQLWVQVDDGWAEESDSRLGSTDLEGATGASAADFDGDGDLDVVVFRSSLTARLLRNDSGTFTDITAQAGIDTGDSQIMGAAWGDYDRDGDLDLAMGGYRGSDRSWLYRNESDGTFHDASGLLPNEIHEGWAFMSAWVDVDGDAYPELLIPNDFGVEYPTIMLHNQGGVSFRIAEETLYHPGHDGMGIVPVDLNGDDYPDWVESTFRDVTLLESVPGPEPLGVMYIRTDRSRGMWVDPPGTGRRFAWGVDAGDLDNDADVDIVVGFGTWDRHKDRWAEPDMLWLQDPDGRFIQASEPRWDEHTTRGVLLADVNGDGWLDIVKRVLDAPSVIHVARCGDAEWTRIRLRQSGANRHAVGAVVDVHSEGKRHRRWITAGSVSMFSGGSPEVHAGLGGAHRIDGISVRWPDGAVTEHTDLPSRRLLTISRLGPVP
ncbi:MAG: hypothetical protein ACI8PZ_002481 [Myxococcota bacterium]